MTKTSSHPLVLANPPPRLLLPIHATLSTSLPQEVPCRCQTQERMFSNLHMNPKSNKTPRVYVNPGDNGAEVIVVGSKSTETICDQDMGMDLNYSNEMSGCRNSGPGPSASAVNVDICSPDLDGIEPELKA
jgi:hypothetical protein